MKLIKASIILAFIAGISLTPRLWINEARFFPLIKPIEIVPAIPTPLDVIVLSLFISASVLWFFFDGRIVGLVAVASLVAMLAQDQMRWQPWVYLYLLMLTPYLLKFWQRTSDRVLLICLQMIVAGVYVWSGIHKFNVGFLDGTFAQMIKALGLTDDLGNWKNFGYLVPLIELSTGIGILVRNSENQRSALPL